MTRSVFIIAEAGVNHNGDMQNAKMLIEEAKKAGADAVKFQTFKAEQGISKFAQKADYQKKETRSDESQLEMVKKLELSFDGFVELKQYCDKIGILFLSTPFDFDSIDFLNSLSLDIMKIPSGEITNLPYLIKVAKLRKKVLLSTGMSNLDEVGLALKVLRTYGTNDITVLHCNTEYPTPYRDVNLRAMLTMREEFHVKIGYSDHTLGIEVPIAAVAMGAEVIEKHFTLDRNMEGPDHKSSLEPRELAAMVEAVRNIEQAIGEPVKQPSQSEIKNLVIARKSIVAAKNIKYGEVFTEDNLTVKRPGNGVSPMKWFDVLGQKAVRDFVQDELIEL